MISFPDPHVDSCRASELANYWTFDLIQSDKTPNFFSLCWQTNRLITFPPSTSRASKRIGLCPASARYFAVHRPARPAHTNLMNKLILKSTSFYLQAFLHILSRWFPTKAKKCYHLLHANMWVWGFQRARNTFSVISPAPAMTTLRGLVGRGALRKNADNAAASKKFAVISMSGLG